VTDHALRESERRWKETGSVEDEAVYLRERLRAGELPLDRLQLAAWLGSEAACLVVPEKPATGAPEDRVRAAADLGINRTNADLEWWLLGLGNWGPETCVRAGLAVARLVLPYCVPIDDCDAALTAAEKWIASPRGEHALEARRLAHAAIDLVSPASDQGVRLSVWVAAEAALIPGAATETDQPPGEAAGRALMLQARRAVGTSLLRAERIRAAVVRVLLSHALGEGAAPGYGE
jgi:hypothetical protein